MWGVLTGMLVVAVVGTSDPSTARVTRLECVSAVAAELEKTSAEPFPLRNALTELQVGPVVSSLSRYPDGGDTHTLIFTLTRDELFSVSVNDPAVVRYDPSNGQDVWQIDPIDPATAQHCAGAG